MKAVALKHLILDAQPGFASGQRDPAGVVQVRMNNVSTEGVLDLSEHLRVPAPEQDIKKYGLAPGDVLFNATNSPELVGKTAYFYGYNEPVVFSNHFIRIRTDRSKLDPLFLSRWLNQQWTRRVFESRCTRWVNQASFRREDLLALEVPLPGDVFEQKRIAAVLDKVDAIRRKRQQGIQLADRFLRSVFLDMFGDPAINPKGLNTAPIKKLGNVVTGNTPSRAHPEFFGDAIEWIKSDNINTPYHFLTKAIEGLSVQGKELGRTVPPNSILVTCIAGSRDCIGNAAIADREVAFNQQINAVTSHEGVDPFFLYTQILVAKQLIQRASTDGMKGLVSKSKFENVLLLAPPEREQREFGSFFKKHIKYMEHLDGAHLHADALFKTASQRAFRGEL